MPCPDGREHQDRQNATRRLDAMTAILCGIMTSEYGSHKSQRCFEFARTWCEYHKEMERLSGLDRVVHFDAIRDWSEKADAVLDRAHAALCV